MDKYQLFALKNAGYAVYKNEDCDNKSRVDSSNSDWNSILLNDNSIVIKQDENYNITKYYLRFQNTVSKAIFDGREYELSSQQLITIPLDFNAKVNKITIEFNGVVDPITIPIKFIDADKHAFDEKVKAAREKEFETKAQIKIATGVDLVNVYFQLCDDSCEKTIVELWTAEGIFSNDNYRYQPLIGGTPTQLLGKFKVEEEMFFKSITGLAKGVYGIRVNQYSKNEEKLFTSEYKYFEL